MPDAPTRRIFVDVSRTAREGTYTGIQKVVRATFRGLVQAGPARGYEIVPVIVEAGAAFRLPGLAPHPYETATSAMTATPPAGPSRLARLRALTARHDGNAAVTIGRAAVRVLFRGERATRGLRMRWRHGAPVAFRASDVFLMPDAAWTSEPWPVVAKVRRAGGRIAAIWYDVIPVTHPDWFDRPLAEAFAAYMKRLLHEADLLVCISRTVRDEVAGLSAGQAGATLAYLYPPASIAPAAADPHPALAAAFARPTVLIVATIEPRKGHALLLDAAERLWSENHDLDLLVIGRVGWKAEGLVERLQSHPERGQRLHLVHDANDRDIAYALGKAAVLALPSSAEGLGLPILEAGLAGCRVLCSDIPVFREIATANTTFFSPHTAEALADGLRALLASENSRATPVAHGDDVLRAYGDGLIDRLERVSPPVR